MTWLTAMEYLCHKLPQICSTCKHFPVLSSFMTYHRVVTRLTRRMSLVEQKLLTLPEHLSSLPVFSEVCVTRSLVLYACFVDRCLFFCTFSFGHCVVSSSSIYGFWLPLWYLQTLLKTFCFNSNAYIQQSLHRYLINYNIPPMLSLCYQCLSCLSFLW